MADHREVRNRATETSVLSYDETRQPPSGARPNRQAMMLLAEPAGRLLEHTGNCMPRGMTVHDRTRLIGQLHLNLPFNMIRRDFSVILVKRPLFSHHC